MKFSKNLIQKLIFTAAAIMSMSVPALADGISNSTIGLGVKNLLTDIGTYMAIIGPIAAAAAAGYFLIRRGMADDQDGKFWMKRITVAIICGISVALVGGLIALISSYFK